jgi:deoxycytidylate deaminase
MTNLVALTPELTSRSLDVIRGMLRDRGLSVSGKADLIDSMGARPPAGPVLTCLVREMRDHDVVVVTLSDPWRWSGILDSFLGPDFRSLACVDEPPEQNLPFAATDFVVGAEQGGRPGLDYAVAAIADDQDLRPNRYEHALFLAEAQAKRSAGMRGGVGCALIEGVGDVIALGTNEVPRAGGGQYWADSPDDARDLHSGVDPAWASKMDLVSAVLQYTEAEQGGSLGDIPALAARFLDHLDNGGQGGRPSHDRAAQTLESLGRVVHAELAALAAAARHGAAVVGAEAVVTRPPCRQCLRQLIVSGASKVCFLGHASAALYPFHADAITTEATTANKVLVVPFSGVTPRGFAKTFGGRRDRLLSLGSALVEAVRESDAPVPSPVPLDALLGALAGRW